MIIEFNVIVQIRNLARIVCIKFSSSSEKYFERESDIEKKITVSKYFGGQALVLLKLRKKLTLLYLIFVLSSCAIPVLEGDWTYTEGNAFYFRIGSTKKECFKILKEKYSEKKVQLVWFIGNGSNYTQRKKIWLI